MSYYATVVTGASSNHCQRPTFPMRHFLTLDAMTPSLETPLSHTAISYSSSQHFPPFRAQFCWSPYSPVSLGNLMLSIPLLHRVHCVPPSTSDPADHTYPNSLSKNRTSRDQIDLNSPTREKCVWKAVVEETHSGIYRKLQRRLKTCTSDLSRGIFFSNCILKNF